MRIKRVQLIFIVLLLISLFTTSCTAPKRPNPKNISKSDQPDMYKNINMDQPRVDNSAEVDDKRTKDNIMPNVPKPTTPNATTGFTLDQINKFSLDIRLTNDDKIDMKYIKGPSNEKSKIETVMEGKSEKTEHEKASREIEKLLKKIPGSSLSDVTGIIDGTLTALKIKRDNVMDFDMDFIFESGESVELKFNKNMGNK
ncbi:MAG TPA: YusW family protein [Clostridia bacterium]|nr:YusW family protein [Clostridia bacterium]